MGRWTIRWFNKPKFHILVHLPEHIRRFGPAILFATEGFESFNAVIRAQSVHSNRQAPSRDIAMAFAKQNRLRHMLSGALFLDHSQIPPDIEGDQRFLDVTLPQKDRVTATQRYFRLRKFHPDHFVQAGPSTLELVDHSLGTVGRYLGLVPSSFTPSPGMCYSLFHLISLQLNRYLYS